MGSLVILHMVTWAALLAARRSAMRPIRYLTACVSVSLLITVLSHVSSEVLSPVAYGVVYVTCGVLGSLMLGLVLIGIVQHLNARFSLFLMSIVTVPLVAHLVVFLAQEMAVGWKLIFATHQVVQAVNLLAAASAWSVTRKRELDRARLLVLLGLTFVVSTELISGSALMQRYMSVTEFYRLLPALSLIGWITIGLAVLKHRAKTEPLFLDSELQRTAKLEWLTRRLNRCG